MMLDRDINPPCPTQRHTGHRDINTLTLHRDLRLFTRAAWLSKEGPVVLSWQIYWVGLQPDKPKQNNKIYELSIHPYLPLLISY